jgi:hypothetical protein
VIAECDPAKKASRYDWSKIPEGYDWIATDKCGAVYMFRVAPPYLGRGRTMWLAPMMNYDKVSIGPECEDWRESLEERPAKSVPVEFPEHELRAARPALMAGQKWIDASGNEVVLEDYDRSIEPIFLRSIATKYVFRDSDHTRMYNTAGIRYGEARNGPSHLVRLVEDRATCQNCTWSTQDIGNVNYACQRHAPPFYEVRADDCCGDWEVVS